MTTRQEYAQQLLAGIGNASPSANTVDWVIQWMNAENTAAANNPLATTWHMPGSYPLAGNPQCAGGGNPPSCVQQYTSEQSGLQATINTIQGGYYPDLIAALRANNEAALGFGGSSPSSGIMANLHTWCGGCGYGNAFTRGDSTGGSTPVPGSPTGTGGSPTPTPTPTPSPTPTPPTNPPWYCNLGPPFDLMPGCANSGGGGNVPTPIIPPSTGAAGTCNILDSSTWGVCIANIFGVPSMVDLLIRTVLVILGIILIIIGLNQIFLNPSSNVNVQQQPAQQQGQQGQGTQVSGGKGEKGETGGQAEPSGIAEAESSPAVEEGAELA
jgi:hypothetical protein